MEAKPALIAWSLNTVLAAMSVIGWPRFKIDAPPPAAPRPARLMQGREMEIVECRWRRFAGRRFSSINQQSGLEHTCDFDLRLAIFKLLKS